MSDTNPNPTDFAAVAALIKGAEEPAEEPETQETAQEPAEEAPPVEPAEDTSEQENTSEADAGEADPEDEPVSLKELAEKLGVDAKLLYEVEIPMQDGEPPITLAEFKDAAKTFRALESERENFEIEKANRDREDMVQRKELTDLLRIIPQHWYTAEIIATARQVAQDMQLRERESLEAAIPELRDPTAYGEFRQRLNRELADYGFRASELDQVVDHRTLRLAADFLDLRDKVKSAAANLESVKKTPKRKPGRKRQTLRSALFKQAKQEGASERTKFAAVSELIKGGS